MTWEDFASARQLLAEERVGVPKRARDYAEKAQAEATKAALRKQGPPVVLKPREVVEPVILEKGKTVRGKVA